MRTYNIRSPFQIYRTTEKLRHVTRSQRLLLNKVAVGQDVDNPGDEGGGGGQEVDQGGQREGQGVVEGRAVASSSLF